MERLSLLMVDQDGEVHVLHSSFSLQVGPYATKRRLLDFRGELTSEGLPPTADIPVASLTVRQTTRNVPREEHMVHAEGISP